MANAGFSNIICPVDGSDSAGRAAAFAAQLASATGANVTLVFAFPASATDLLGSLGYPGVAGEAVRLSPADVENAMNEASANAFAQAREAIGATQANVSQTVVRGNPAEQIVGYARDAGEALIVMGSRGLSPMKEVLMGSVSDRVLRHAPCPVTIVH